MKGDPMPRINKRTTTQPAAPRITAAPGNASAPAPPDAKAKAKGTRYRDGYRAVGQEQAAQRPQRADDSVESFLQIRQRRAKRSSAVPRIGYTWSPTSAAQ